MATSPNHTTTIPREEFAGSALHFQRADEHLQAFGVELQWFRQDDPYNVAVQQWTQARELAILLTGPDKAPMKWSALVGDVVQNLRNSLDNMVYELAVDKLGKPPATNTGFPVYVDANRLAQRKGGLYGMIDERAQTFIEWLQPDDARKREAGHPLWQLHELSVIDKHRALHVIALTVKESRLRITTPSGRLDWPISPGPLIPNTVITRVPIASLPRPLSAEMHMEFNAAVEVAFSSSGPPHPLTGRPVRESLIRIRDAVGFTLEAMRTFMKNP